MYLPALIDLETELGATPSLAQLTISTFMVGMAIGQLFFGSISDSIGRKKPLVVGSALFLAASVGCAMAPSIGFLIVMRLIQGLAGGATAVVSRSVVPDLAHGKEAASAFSALMAVQGLAPAIAPLLGGFLSPVVGWRGIFWIIAAFNLVGLVLSIVVVKESRKPEDRSSGALRNLFPSIGRCLQRPVFVGYLLAFAIGFGVLFSYISASPYVLEHQLGLSTQMYAITFAVNSLAIAFVSALNGKLVRRFSMRRLLFVGLATLLVGSALLLVVGWLGPWLWPTLVLLFINAAAMGLVLGNSTTLGVEAVRDIGAGAGSGAFGALQMITAGVVSPLVGLGSSAAVSMSTCQVVCAVIALGGCALLTRGRR